MEDLKAQVRALESERAGLEAEAAAAAARLDAAGVGAAAPLVDAEGFPRADVDVAACRADRHLLAVLSTDHKALSARLEAALHALHAAARAGGGGAANGGAFSTASAAPRRAPRADAPEMIVDEAGRVASAIAVPAASVQPFATVDEVAEGGPAAEAGVQVGDAVVRFGHATAQSPAPMAAVAAALAAAEGGAVEAVVRRRGAGAAVTLTLTLRPRAWAGRGLLGCHLTPLGGREH